MRLRGRLLRLGAALVLAAGSMGPLAAIQATRVSAAVNTYQVGVDNANPSGKNFEFTDFYPRAGLVIHNGDVVHFGINAGATPDSFHTATLGKLGEPLAQIAQNHPFALP